MAKIRKQPRTYKPDEAAPAFIMARLVMLDSVAYWALRPIERTILNVIEIEHMRHGGVENGNLIVTRRQLEKRGIWKMAIAPGLRALVALGFIELTARGAAGVGEHAQAHRFRLTYVQPHPTDEWRKHHDPVRAKTEAETARANADIRARRLGLRGAKKRVAGLETDTGKVSKTRPAPTSTKVKMTTVGLETETGAGLETETTFYISGDRGALPETGHQARAAPTPPDELRRRARSRARQAIKRQAAREADRRSNGHTPSTRPGHGQGEPRRRQRDEGETIGPSAIIAEQIAKLPWSKPRTIEITPEIDEALNLVETEHERVPVDALAAFEWFLLNSPPNSFAGSDVGPNAIH